MPRYGAFVAVVALACTIVDGQIQDSGIFLPPDDDVETVFSVESFAKERFARQAVIPPGYTCVPVGTCLNNGTNPPPGTVIDIRIVTPVSANLLPKYVYLEDSS